MRSPLSIFLSMSLMAQSAYSAPTQTPAKDDTPRVEYYTPCADLLKTVKDKRFEEHLAANINQPAQLVQLLKDYGIFNVDTIRYIIDRKLDELEIAPANEFKGRYEKGSNPYQWHETQKRNDDYYYNPITVFGNNGRTFVIASKEETIGKLLSFIARPSRDLAPIAWDTFESIKLIAASHPDDATAKVTHTQFLRLVEALKANPTSKKIVENLFIDLMRKEALNIADTIKGPNSIAEPRLNALGGWVVNVPLIALTIMGLRQFLPADCSDQLTIFMSMIGGILAISSQGDDHKWISAKVYNKIFNPNRVSKRYQKLRNALPTESAETQLIASELLTEIKIGPLPTPKPLAISATLYQLCSYSNICELTYSQIAYAGDSDLIRLDSLNHQLSALIEEHKVLTGAKPLTEATDAAAQSSSSVEQLLKFRQALAMAARDTESESAQILNVITKISDNLNQLKMTIENLRKRNFQFALNETSEESLQKKSLVAAILKTNSEIIDQIEFDSSQLKTQIQRSYELTKKLRALDQAQPQDEASVRAQAEEVLLLLEQYNLDGV